MNYQHVLCAIPYKPNVSPCMLSLQLLRRPIKKLSTFSLLDLPVWWSSLYQGVATLVLMSVAEQSSSDSSNLPSLPLPVRDVDPLLKDLNEKKLSFRRNVVSLAAEIKEVRSRLASQEQSFARETLCRRVKDLLEAETKAQVLEEAVHRLQKTLEERNCQPQTSASTTDEYLNELDELRSQLAATKVTVDAGAVSAQSAQLQCLALLKELHEKTNSLKEHEDRVTRLGEQLDKLKNDLQATESSQIQLKDEVVRIEHHIMQAITRTGSNKDCELRKLLDEVSPKNFEKISKVLVTKDDEIAKVKDEIKIMSAHWKPKTKELESQLEKQRHTDQELKKRVLKVEFCLREARAQTRKLQRMGERRDKTVKELREQLAAKHEISVVNNEKQNFWESSSFKAVVSMSLMILVLFSKR